MTEFKIKLPNLKAQQIEEVHKALLVLTPKHLSYELDFTASNMINPDDEKLGWGDPERSYLNCFMLRESISGVEISLIDVEKELYMMMIMGRDGVVKLFFDDFSEALKMRASIETWLLS